MKIYKLIIFVLILAISGQLYAQKKAPKTPEQKASEITARMKTNLGLTVDQESKIYNLQLEKIKELKDLEGSKFSNGDKKLKKEEKRKIKKEYNKKISDILTPEQKKKRKDLIPKKG